MCAAGWMSLPQRFYVGKCSENLSDLVLIWACQINTVEASATCTPNRCFPNIGSRQCKRTSVPFPSAGTAPYIRNRAALGGGLLALRASWRGAFVCVGIYPRPYPSRRSSPAPARSNPCPVHACCANSRVFVSDFRDPEDAGVGPPSATRACSA